MLQEQRLTQIKYRVGLFFSFSLHRATRPVGWLVCRSVVQRFFLGSNWFPNSAMLVCLPFRWHIAHLNSLSSVVLDAVVVREICRFFSCGIDWIFSAAARVANSTDMLVHHAGGHQSRVELFNCSKDPLLTFRELVFRQKLRRSFVRLSREYLH